MITFIPELARGFVYPETMVYRSLFLFITLFWFLFSNPCYSKITNTLHQGQEFKDWDELISSNRVFSLKFFSFGTMVSPYLGVFYNKEQFRYSNSDYYQKRVSDHFSNSAAVWVANRNHPIPDIYGKLDIDVHGKFSILSSGGTVLDLFSPTQLVTRNASVTLLDSGNLVLQELRPDGFQRVLWQSFDYPTDTLLPGMKLGINLETGHIWSLTSWRNDELPAEGLFTLVGDLNRTGQIGILRQGNVHWTSGPWQNGEFKNTNLQSSGPDVRLYYISNETEQSFTYLTRTYDSYPVLRMGQDGQLRGSPLNFSVHCRYIDDPPGCAEDEFEKIECREDYLFRQASYYESFLEENVYDETYNLYDCQGICWSNCSCVAYSTTRNRLGCKTYGKKLSHPGIYREETAQYYVIYNPEEMKENKAWIALIIMIVPLAVLLSCFWICKNINFKEIAKKIKKVFMLQMRHMRRFYIYLRTDKNVNTELRYFTFQSISSATNNFSSTNMLGKGGFGEVYKGKLVDGQEVAVKRLSRSSGQGVKEFKNEMELIAKLQHTNLVRLLGFCVEKQEKILVYEYMSNNSLDFFLFDPRKKGLLDWNNRFVIIDGIAQGLLYLHKFSRLRIIHRDLKASNILLDDYLKPKISDFGMAKLFGINESEANTSRPVGTRGYMPPEYLIDGIISTKIDVFGFGVLLLEIISSKMNHVSYDVDHPLNLLGLAWELWNKGRALELMDPILEDTCSPKEVMTCIHVGLLCVQDHATDRPTMSEVASMLTNEHMHLPGPKRPAYFIERDEAGTKAEAGGGVKSGKGSENSESISILVSK
ncbi:G-type lectin S-receptor-like serine/threonine-protein kinase At1g67520 [Bidens hawaiensis]|uniref:G-type lectin S-receptor-like serine/threonine-protein kinase At1g67520 n=1 Tax=Bidens hawaiensis TaxID=980011 RepID=UPI00404B1596